MVSSSRCFRLLVLSQGFNMTPPVHSEVFSSIVDMLPGGAFSGYLPYCCLLVGSIVLISCWVSFMLVRSVQSAPSCRSAYCGPLQIRFQFKKSTPVVVPVIPDLFLLLVDRSVVQSARRHLLAYLYRFCCCGDSLLWFALPVVPDFWFSWLFLHWKLTPVIGAGIDRSFCSLAVVADVPLYHSIQFNS
jgi:hypothetical protein